MTPPMIAIAAVAVLVAFAAPATAAILVIRKSSAAQAAQFAADHARIVARFNAALKDMGPPA